MNQNIASEVIVSVITYYDLKTESGRVRFKQSINSIRKINEFGAQIIIVDGGSSDEVLDTFKDLKVSIYVKPELSMAQSRKLSLSLANQTNKKIIVSVDLEKDSFFDHIYDVCLPVFNEEADMIIPKRKSLDSYPLFQAECELLGNYFFKNITGKSVDVWFGARVYHRKLNSYFLEYDEKYGDKWNEVYVPLYEIAVSDAKIKSMDIDYIHPKNQSEVEITNLDFDKKRIDQLYIITSGIKKRHDETN